MLRTAYWDKILDRASRSPYLALLLVASVLLSVASFYTTYDGMSAFLEYAVFAAFVTLGIQSLLFVTSWRLGFMFADKEPLAWGELIVFLVCFCLSVVFSFASLFDVVFAKPQQELARITRVHNGVAESIASAGDKARVQRRELVQSMLSAPEYAAWSAQVSAVADLAAESKDLLAQVVAESHQRRRERAGRLAAEAQETAASEHTLERQLKEDTAALQRADERRPALSDEIARLNARLDESNAAIVEQQHRMDAEERGVGETGKPKRGPVWAKLSKEQQRLIAGRDATASLIALKTGQLKALDAERQSLQERMDRTRGQQADIGSRIAESERAAAQARQELDGPGAGAGLDLEQNVQALRNALPEFARTLDLAAFDRAANLCKDLMDAMGTVPSLAPRLQGLSCDRGPLLGLQNPIDQAAAALAVQERDCLAGGKNAKTVDNLAFAEALSYARTCLDASRLPNDTIRPERREIDRLEREENPQASPFTKTTNALLAGEKLAILALAIALAIDLLVFFTGLVGAKSIEATVEAPVDPVLPNDSYNVKLYKYVLGSAHAVRLKVDKVRYEHRVRLSDIRDDGVREAVRQFLSSNTARGLVLPHPQEEGVFLLRYGMAEELRARLAQEGPRAEDRGPRPSSEPAPRTATPAASRPPQTRRPAADLAFEFLPVDDAIPTGGVSRTRLLDSPTDVSAVDERAFVPAAEPPAPAEPAASRGRTADRDPFADLDRLMQDRD